MVSTTAPLDRPVRAPLTHTDEIGTYAFVELLQCNALIASSSPSCRF